MIECEKNCQSRFVNFLGLERSHCANQARHINTLSAELLVHFHLGNWRGLRVTVQ